MTAYYQKAYSTVPRGSAIDNLVVAYEAILDLLTTIQTYYKENVVGLEDDFLKLLNDKDYQQYIKHIDKLLKIINALQSSLINKDPQHKKEFQAMQNIYRHSTSMLLSIRYNAKLENLDIIANLITHYSSLRDFMTSLS